MDTDRLDRCQSCLQVVPRRTLAMMKRKFKVLQGMNLLPYSEYTASGWTGVNATAHGTYLSLGLHPDIRLCKVNSTGHATATGISTFTASYDADASPHVYQAVTHAADFYYVFSAWVGQYEEGTYSSPMVFSLGTSDGTTFTTVSDWTIISPTRIWYCNSSKASAATINWAIQATKGSSDNYYWWFEHAQLESSTSTPYTGPGTFIKTVGTAITRSIDTQKTEVAKVCPRCRERLVEAWELRGVPMEDADSSIPFFGGS